ncbi:MAG: SDR family NAD(P)-dependent oxidoreductase [Candidatus Pristimantibacillus sp.]
MKTNEQERIALITGASNGIGLQLTLKMLTEGWQIIALNRSDFPEGITLIQDSLRKGTLRIYKTDPN